MDTTKKIKNLKGEFIPKTFPTQKELNKLPKIEINGKEIPDKDKLEHDTIGNVIINCLAMYVSKDKRDGFYCNVIAESVLSGGKKVELKDKFSKFLIEVLEESAIREVEEGRDKEKKVKGIYSSWIIAQVLSELGEKYD